MVIADLGHMYESDEKPEVGPRQYQIGAHNINVFHY